MEREGVVGDGGYAGFVDRKAFHDIAVVLYVPLWIFDTATYSFYTNEGKHYHPKTDPCKTLDRPACSTYIGFSICILREIRLLVWHNMVHKVG